MIDPFHLQDGTITIRHVHRPIEVRVGDLRRHMQFLVCWILAGQTSALYLVVKNWTDVRMYVESHLTLGKQATIGQVKTPKGWKETPQTSEHREFCRLVFPFLYRGMHLSNLCAVRFGKGCSKLRHCQTIMHLTLCIGTRVRAAHTTLPTRSLQVALLDSSIGLNLIRTIIKLSLIHI